MTTVTARLQSPSHPNPPSQSHPFSTTSQSPFQLRPISPHPHYPHLPPHPQPSPERRYKANIDKERDRFTLDRRGHERVERVERERRDMEHERRDLSLRDERERGVGDRRERSVSRELPVRDRRELALREEREFKEHGKLRDNGRERDRDSRRPLSPSSLKDINLPTPISPHSPLDPNSLSPGLHPRDPNSTLPAPPTGHDLMAMFPARSPHLAKPPPEAHASQHRVESSTSGYFQRQERAFFAQAGREIIRVRLEIDSAGDKYPPAPLEKSFSTSPHMHHPHSSPEAARYQLPPHPHPHSHPHSHSHPHAVSPGSADAITPPPMEGVRSAILSDGMEGIEGPDDESWRRPMPYAERRRAGKHTRRVVVRN
ncbi:hypothetical protein E1B28_013715 [Marasmius oreades]|uniref:Uncharacterized protein n=1 Tax=Marasmius oreades TaxID=181124 RepID=A0A9P7RQY8_9AGAR|nr:uncharacterized protein E1B28_013715 [Marasmius oreades]KAG7087773.1 hypothetical protein E1B28_013715 [Marasmius oreades]